MWRVLIVDDNFNNQQLLLDYLEEHATCDVAVDGKEAIEAYNNSLNGDKYDLILLDIAMPEINGLEFLKILRAHEKSLGFTDDELVRVIMISAYEEYFSEAKQLGCNDFILKPILSDTLIKKIKGLL